MDKIMMQLNKTLESLVAATDEQIMDLCGAKNLEDKYKSAGIIQLLSASQKNICEVIEILDEAQCASGHGHAMDDLDDCFDDDDFAAFMNSKQVDFKSVKKKGGCGKKKRDDDPDTTR